MLIFSVFKVDTIMIHLASEKTYMAPQQKQWLMKISKKFVVLRFMVYENFSHELAI